MANEKNLIPVTMRSKEDAKKIQIMGGKALQKKKREERTFSNLCKQLLSLKAPKKIGNSDIFSSIKEMFPDVNDEEITNRLALLTSTFKEALKGNIKAIEFVRDTALENPNIDKDKKDVNIFFNAMSEEDLDKKIQELQKKVN